MQPTRLRDWRLREGWTIDEVSDLTGYSAAMISRVERGERQMSPKAKVAVSRRLGVAVRDLFDHDEPPDAA